MADALPSIPAVHARRLFMQKQGLLWDPDRRVGPRTLQRAIEQMGFVQVDTISVVLRAHHQILLTRFHGYQHRHLRQLLERDRALFEHWTHDASIIPEMWLRHWIRRFEAYPQRVQRYAWWRERMGPNAQKMIQHVRDRIEAEGPLRSRDFEHDAGDAPGAWWGWKPQKAALEYLWRCGELAITARENFHKVYDLKHRVYPQIADYKPLSDTEHVAWACTAALERLGTATASEIAGFINAVSSADARAWCEAAARRNEIVPIRIESADGSPARAGYAQLDWERQLNRLPDPLPGIRLLSPFDPLIRDRKRAKRLFDFDYRFEAFVPAPKRVYGYYTMPILEGDRIVGRVDAKLHRKKGEIEVNGLWWEPRIRPTKKRLRELDSALQRLVTFQ